MTFVEDFMGQPLNSIATTTAQGGAYAMHDSVVTAYLDAQHTNFGSDNDVINAAPLAIYDRPFRNYVEYIRSGATKYLTRANSGVVGYRDEYLIPNFNFAIEYLWQNTSLALHYLYTGDTTTLASLGDIADRMCYFTNVTGSLIDNTLGSNSARLQAHGLEALISAQYVGAPSDGAPGGSPGGQNYITTMATLVDGILATMSPDGGHRFTEPLPSGATYWTYPYQQGLLDEALIHYYLLYANSARKATILAALIKRAEFQWITMLDDLNNPTGPAFLYLEASNPPSSGPELYDTIGKPNLTGFNVGPHGFLYNQTADPTYRVRGLQMLQTVFDGDHAYTGALMANFANDPSSSTLNIQHKVLSEITRTSYRALYYFLNTPAVTHSGVPINTVVPVITQPTPGNYVCSPGTWLNSPSSYIYSWRRAPLAGSSGGAHTIMQSSATADYAAQASDIGYRPFCVVQATNGIGPGILARAVEGAEVTTIGSTTLKTGPLTSTDTKDTMSVIGRSGTKIRLNWV